MSFRCWAVNWIVFITPFHHAHGTKSPGCPAPVSFGNCRKFRFGETISSGPEAVLRGGAGAGPGGAGATQPHRAGDPGVPETGAPFLHHRGQLVRGEGPDHPR